MSLAEDRARSVAGAKLREAVARSRVERLTRREREVLAGVAGGLSNRLIGERLSISPRTVEIHRANMLNKMGASHTSEAIRIAIEASLVN
jgi:DNA-binding NarL/FixJ family response regulator